jgi:DNA-nicking Smr family endonuclease
MQPHGKRKGIGRNVRRITRRRRIGKNNIIHGKSGNGECYPHIAKNATGGWLNGFLD